MKKKIYSKWITILCVCSLISCSDFLEESSLDEVKPSTVTDLEQLMLGEAYLGMNSIFDYIELLTDNVESSFSTALGQEACLRSGGAIFTWQPDMYEQMELNGVVGRDTWQNLYQKIKGCNVVLDMLDEVTGSKSDRLNLKGQALSLRAFYYFMLVNTYALPYNAKGIDIETALGVPLIIEATVKDEFPIRASVGDVYRQIEKDLLEAKLLMDQYGQANYQYKVTPLFVDLLLSRMYLYMEKWDQVVKYASSVITQKPTLRKLSDYYRIVVDEWWGTETLTYDRDQAGVYNSDSPELIWGYGQSGSYGNYYVGIMNLMYEGNKPAFSVSQDLVNLYEAKDMRLHFYYEQYFIAMLYGVTAPLVGEKCKNDPRYNASRGMRVAEAYLNRAEANIRLFLNNGDENLRKAALRDLNYLREHRFETSYEEVDKTGQELLDFCLAERRRELSFEDHRWFDLRRLGMPEIKHQFTISAGQTQEYVLPANGARYVLPIPKVVLEENPALIQNP